MLKMEERLKGVQKWFIAGQRHPFIPRLLGIVEKEDIPLIEGIDISTMMKDDVDVDGIAIIDASMGEMTLNDLLHHRTCMNGEEGEEEEVEGSPPFDLRKKSVICGVLIDVCCALSFLHNEMGIVHGCVNSHSILLRYSKEAGRLVASLGEVGMWTQSMLNDDRIRWIAPEVIASDGAMGPSFASDVWSIGMLMEEMLTGKVPFQSKDTTAAIAVAVALRQFESHSFRVDVPTRYHDLIEQCRLSVPEERPFITSILGSLMDMNSSDE
jgi:serine/threonine protein kinase